MDIYEKMVTDNIPQNVKGDDACKILGIPKSEIIRYIRAGLLTPLDINPYIFNTSDVLKVRDEIVELAEPFTGETNDFTQTILIEERDNPGYDKENR